MTTCRAVRDALPEYAAGRSLPSGPRIAEHLSHCAACAAADRELRAVFAALAAAPEIPHPAGGEQRARLALQAGAAGTSAAGSLDRPPVRRRFLFMAGAAIGAGFTAALVAVQPWRASENAGALVEAAVQRANTWHLQGWKIRDGRRIAWEVWGRRSPFLYREQIGDELKFDDGRQRVRVLSAGRQGKRAAVRVATGPALGDSSQSLFTTGTGWRQMKPWRETRDVAIFRSGSEEDDRKAYRPTGDYYTVDKRTWLPLRKEHVADPSTRPRLVSTFSAEYDVMVPDAVATLPVPAAVPQRDGPGPPLGIATTKSTFTGRQSTGRW